ncbi:hypothetical protein JOC34_003441 [Virgibacillus halotolerans]|uniref:hypothetical protein n=1 Tax=Virgibacillus halotolerans TaxID=1071053 RepID=UPI001960E1FD|nr:hypothetical protein [Virgibacillus halotolerans]MBM7601020.1 hypothetical protein [Virgibacillus halotolerans]
MKRFSLFFLVISVSLVLTACGGDSPENNWVLEKSRVGDLPEVEDYVAGLQNNPDTRGFKVFTISEGKKMVVVSTGNADKSLELDDVVVDSGDTKIIIDEMEKKNEEDNPYIMIGLGAIKGELFVQSADENGFDEL